MNRGKLSLLLAFRYLRGKRSLNAVPILSRISMVAIAFAAAAMIILFSVFNGFEGVVHELYNAFYPDLKISAVKGKFFTLSNAQVAALRRIDGVSASTATIEDNVLANSGDQQIVVTLRGIDPDFMRVNDIRSFITEGEKSVQQSGGRSTAILGSHIAAQLGVSFRDNPGTRIQIYYPDASKRGFTSENAFETLDLQPTGEFHIQDEFDAKYILAPIGSVQGLFLQPDRYSSVELKVSGHLKRVQEQIKTLLGPGFRVASRYEQNQSLYKVMQTEKWVVYAVLSLVLLIASFNMIGALSLLVLEKQKDISILRTLGADRSTIRNIFLLEGCLWAILGGCAGLLLGLLVCLVQIVFKPIKIEGAFIIDAYPVSLQAPDFLVILLTIFFVGLLASWFPAKRTAAAAMISLKS